MCLRYLILPSFSPELSKLGSVKSRLKHSMDTLVSRAADDLGLDSKEVKLNEVSQLGYHFRAVRKHGAKINKMKAFSTLECRKVGQLFLLLTLSLSCSLSGPNGHS